MKNRPVLILRYISKHLNASFDSDLVGSVKLDKFEVNEILFNLLQEELITDTNGVLHITQKGNAYLHTAGR